MRVDLNAKVQSREGEDLGNVERAIFDPQSQRVTGFVVGTGGLFGRDVVVDAKDVEQSSRGGNVIRLELSRAEVENLPTFVADDFATPPIGWEPPASLGFGVGGFAWPAGVFYEGYPGVVRDPVLSPDPATTGDSGEPVRKDEIAPGETDGPSIAKGATVVDRHGDDIGSVEDVVLDPASGQVRGFVLKIGGALESLFGGGHMIEISADQVAGIDAGLVQVKLIKDELKVRSS